ncbi:hypothetical protein PDJAM_G00209130 [Pangasius djambal]|uniref:Uncharacterized protein n=1 Tax=Pangasius djambal TaxID=1691987 RepID=A0ACC5YAW4_9TELE|nr:hypothetical protein [Pangasius djambal]
MKAALCAKSVCVPLRRSLVIQKRGTSQTGSELRASFRPQKKKSNISRNQLESIFKELEHKVITLIKNELKRFRKLLSPDYPACTEREVEDEEDLHSVREGALKITLHVLKNMNHTDLANTLHNKPLTRGQQGKQSMMGVCGVVENAPGARDTAFLTNVLDGGKRSPNDLLCCPHHSPHTLPVQGTAASTPHRDTAG